MKRLYSIEAPDQARLKVARLEVEAVLRKHDLAGVVVLHTPGMVEFFYDIRPSYSCAWIDESIPMLRVKSKLAEYDGNAVNQRHDQAATANMTRSFEDALGHAWGMFLDVSRVIDQAFGSTHTPGDLMPDPMEAKRQ